LEPVMSMINELQKTAKIATWMLVGLLGVGLALYEYSSLRAWYCVRQLGKNNPNLSLTPIPPPDSRSADLGGARIERAGISMQSPWKVIEKEQRIRGNATMKLTGISFPAGQLVIVVFSPVLEKRAKFRAPGLQRRILTRLCRSEGFKSGYDRMAAEMDATPAQVKWWGTCGSNVRNTFLLRVKSSYVGYRPTVIYTTHFGELRGFQIGNPSVRPFDVKLALFDQSGRQYGFVFSGRDCDHPILSQAQVNAFVASIRPVSLISGSASPNER
jgi:hypothetical protein